MRSEIKVHLSKLENNLRSIKSRLKTGVKVMAVIKDDAYGHGAIPVAKHLADNVDWFCVATLDEAIELREGGIKKPLLVFEVPDKDNAGEYLNHDITATVSDISTFDILQEGTEYQLNFDTGMRRLGIPISDSKEAFEKFNAYKKLKCTGLYTHFCSSDEPDNTMVEQQLLSFKDIISMFPDYLMRHTANTGAIFYYQHLDLQFDAVRPGVCLYGYLAGESESPDLQPIIEWKSHVMQTRKIKKGESVGYGQSWAAPKDGIVGTIPVGYGDGVQRLISGKFKVEINSKQIQQVGRVSMDYFGVYCEESSFKRNDEVTIFDGENLSPKNWAKTLDTIPYEIVTNLNRKVKREYIS